MIDVAIIGGGVVGALTARELSRYNASVCVLERSSDVASGASGANSGIVHGGFDAQEGTLKAKYNVLGNAMMESLAGELGVKFVRNTSIVLAFDGNDRSMLSLLQKRGVSNGAGKTEMLDSKAVALLEPNVSNEAVGGLRAVSGGIVSPYGLTIAAMGNAMDNGADLRLGFEVVAIDKDKDGFVITSKSGESVAARVVINCAGIYADVVANLIGDKSFKIGARKGEYILLDRECKGFVGATLFSCPSEKGKGILVSPTADGNILLGPTSIESEREDTSVNADSFKEIIAQARRMCPDLPLHGTITSFCGVRAFSDRHDFIIEHSKTDERFINVAGIESPGLTASPAIAKDVAKMAVGLLGNVSLNGAFNPIRKPDYFFKGLSREQQNALIKENGDFGKIVCRCEEVTLGELIFALDRNPRALTIDGAKRRTRAGMGRCQGGFCHPSVADILHGRFGIEYDSITKNGKGSWIFTGKTK